MNDQESDWPKGPRYGRKPTEEELKYLLANNWAWLKFGLEDYTPPDLSGIDLGGVDLKRAELDMANLQEADLNYSDLRGAYLRSVNFSNAKVEGARHNRWGRYRGASIRANSALRFCTE